MAIQLDSIAQLNKWLGTQETAAALKLSKQQDRLESKWRRWFETEIKSITRKIASDIRKGKEPDWASISFEELILKHSLEVSRKAIQSADALTPIRPQQLASKSIPKARIATSFSALREAWDQWRKNKKLPPRQRELADKIKEKYLDKVQSVWKKYSADFIEGDTAHMDAALRAIQRGADVAYSRAKMIVATETTYYYNKVRKEIYGDSKDVSHFLFMAIRDHRTTKWCKTRHGLVYSKDDPLSDKETPPIHWNCRSEILPLTPQNPRHLALIKSKSRARRSHTPEPLPKGWTGR